jgi:hypothetical protein
MRAAAVGVARGLDPGRRSAVRGNADFAKLLDIREPIESSIERRFRPRGWNPNGQQSKNRAFSSHNPMVAPEARVIFETDPLGGG